MIRPDILFIVLDTQRADRLGCYGNERGLSPNLDRFASAGTVFEQAIAPAQWTIPSHASMFTGLYPTSHQVTQSSQSIGSNTPHIAELLTSAGYESVGFCNNPLVGILNNGFKRGFQQFYNYGGAFPSLPHASSRLPWPLDRIEEAYTQFLRRISYPIQNYFGRSDLAFRFSLQSWATPLWSKLANFKGQNARSVKDVSHFLRTRDARNPEKPLFLFLNLMETHLPFWPPGRFVDQFAPYFRGSKEARTIMRNWNREAYRWAAPLNEPLGELEGKVLSDIYDAEVAYQDDYLQELFSVIENRAKKSNTLTIIVSDHGDGLGEHGFMGHAFVAYQELVHVPLIIRWPGKRKIVERVAAPISTRRVFHTMLGTAGVELGDRFEDILLDADRLTLDGMVSPTNLEQESPISEIFPPLNFVKAIEQRQPQLLEQFNCLAERRAIIAKGHGSIHKLISINDRPDQLFDLFEDPEELDDILENRQLMVKELDGQLTTAVENALQQQKKQMVESDPNLESDDHLVQRLRGLGYVD